MAPRERMFASSPAPFLSGFFLPGSVWFALKAVKYFFSFPAVSAIMDRLNIVLKASWVCAKRFGCFLYTKNFAR